MPRSKEHTSESIHKCFIVSFSFSFVKDSDEQQEEATKRLWGLTSIRAPSAPSTSWLTC
jgi:hypothetical protein